MAINSDEINYSSMLPTLQEAQAHDHEPTSRSMMSDSSFTKIIQIENGKELNTQFQIDSSKLCDTLSVNNTSFNLDSLIVQPNTLNVRLYDNKEDQGYIGQYEDIQTQFEGPAYEKLDSETTSSKLMNNVDLNNFINEAINNMKLQTVKNTAVEQPNIGSCSCFICGLHLPDFDERFSYLKFQKLFSMQMPLLQLLSDILNQTVITNTDSIDLCPKCSETINDIDLAYKHLSDLKTKVINLFSSNERPKLTFHVLSQNDNDAKISFNNEMLQPVYKKSSSIDLEDLAKSRPKRGRASKKFGSGSNNIKKCENQTAKVKSKGGRPRKPFQCRVCKRKFLSQDSIQNHIRQEHPSMSSGIKTLMVKSNVGPKVSSSSGHVLSKDEESLNFNGIKRVKTEVSEEEKCSQISVDLKTQINPTLNSRNKSSLDHPDLQNSSSESINYGSRPIQPKPQTLVQTNQDGSLLFLMKPTTKESSHTLIKVSPGYFNLKVKKIACEICNKSFGEEKSFYIHRSTVHGIKKKREHNGASFETENVNGPKFLENKYFSRTTGTDNLKDLPKNKQFICDTCNETFNYKYEYESHKETHLPFSQVGPHEFVCCICGLKVASKAALKIHLHRFHENEPEPKDFLCAICGYMTNTKKAFSDHLRMHNDSPSQKTQCHLCKKEMLSSSYKIHMLRMHGESKYPCETCGQRFSIRSDLMRHLNVIHSSLRPYTCNLCSKKFITSEALRYHKNKMHSMVFHFCEVCGKNYKWKGELRSHINRCHGPKLRNQCSFCPKTYADSKKLRHHMVTKHNVHHSASQPQCKIIFDASKDFKTILEEDVTKNKKDSSPLSTYEPQGVTINTEVLDNAALVQTLGAVNQDNLHRSEETDLTTIQTYQHSENESITLSTLESHIPTDRCCTTQLQDHSHYSQVHTLWVVDQRK